MVALSTDSRPACKDWDCAAVVDWLQAEGFAEAAFMVEALNMDLSALPQHGISGADWEGLGCGAHR